MSDATSAIDRAMADPKSGAASAIDRAMGTTSSSEENGPTGTMDVTERFWRNKKEEADRKKALLKAGGIAIDTDTKAKSVSKELNVPMEFIDTSGADFGMRVNFSFSDSDEDIREKFKKDFPQGEIFRLRYTPKASWESTGKEFSYKETDTLVYREVAYDENGEPLPVTKDSKIKTIEGSGTGINDVADVVGPALPFVGAVAAGPLAPAGVIWGALATGAGYMAGELAKHEINIFAFDSDMTQKEALADAAREGRDMAIIMAVTGGAYKGAKFVAQRGAKIAMSDASAEIKAIRQRAMKWVEEQKGAVEGLNASQVSPENAILGLISNQGMATSATGKHAAVRQQTGPVNVIESDVVSTPEEVGKQLVTIVKRAYTRTENRIRSLVFGRTRATPEQGGTALIEGSRRWQIQEGPRGKLGVEYAIADKLAEQSGPRFALHVAATEEKQSVRQVIYDIKNAVNAEARSLESTGINVAETPIGKLQALINDIDSISSVQFDYKVIKELKTRAGQIIETWPWNSSVNSHQARRLFGTLSDVMMNPVNANPATKAFTEQMAKTNGIARAYYDMMDDKVIRGIISSTNANMLAAELGTPGALTKNVRKMISEMPSEYSSTFKTSVLTNDILLNPGGSTKAIAEWELRHPEGWTFLTGNDKALERSIKSAANSMDELRASNLANVISYQTKNSQSVAELLKKPGTGPSETLALVKSVGEEGREKLRQGMYHDIVDTVVSEGRRGIPRVDNSALAQIIKEYKKTGAWQHVLTQADRVHLLGMKSYIDLVYKGAQDAGVSLESAKAITELKKPSTFISGAHKLTVNAIAAKIIMSPTFTEWVISHNLGKPIIINSARSKVKFFGLMTEALLEGTEPGQDVDPASKALDAIYDIDLTVKPVVDYLSQLEIPRG